MTPQEWTKKLLKVKSSALANPHKVKRLSAGQYFFYNGKQLFYISKAKWNWLIQEESTSLDFSNFWIKKPDVSFDSFGEAVDYLKVG